MEYWTFFWKSFLVVGILVGVLLLGFTAYGMLLPKNKRQDLNNNRGQIISLLILIATPILLYEFININVIPHTIFLVLTGFIFKDQIIDFVYGAKFKLNKNVKVGDTFIVDDKELGVILKLNMFSLVLNDANRTTILQYGSLRNKVIQISHKQNNAGYVNFDIHGDRTLTQIESLLYTSPYIDTATKPRIERVDATTINIKCSLLEHGSASSLRKYLESHTLTTKA